MSHQQQYVEKHSQEFDPYQTIAHFDKVIHDLYTFYQNNNIADTITKVKPLIKNPAHFGNLVSSLVNNSSYQYHDKNYPNFKDLANKVAHEFTPEEQLFMIANMPLYDIGYNSRTTELFKYFLCKILKNKLEGNISISS